VSRFVEIIVPICRTERGDLPKNRRLRSVPICRNQLSRICRKRCNISTSPICRKSPRVCRKHPESVEIGFVVFPCLSKQTPRFVETCPTFVEEIPVFVEDSPKFVEKYFCILLYFKWLCFALGAYILFLIDSSLVCFSFVFISL